MEALVNLRELSGNTNTYIMTIIPSYGKPPLPVQIYRIRMPTRERQRMEEIGCGSNVQVLLRVQLIVLDTLKKKKNSLPTKFLMSSLTSVLKKQYFFSTMQWQNWLFLLVSSNHFHLSCLLCRDLFWLELEQKMK